VIPSCAPRCPVGRTGLAVPPLGFGAFKIGRNEGIKYPSGYELPSEDEAARLLNGVLDLGCTLIDTAPAYGLSEERIGRHLARRRGEFVLSTKVGETFADGQSTFDFTEPGVRASLERSRSRLKSDVLDIVFIHSPGNDRDVLEQSDVVAVLKDYRERNVVRAIGLSGKTVEGACMALEWADALMVEFHPHDTSHRDVIEEAGRRGVAVFVKKGLASGRISPQEAIPFALRQTGVTSLIVGGLNFHRFRSNWELALECRGQSGRGASETESEG
jgi:aryl-alcohol dehydrogenase-like predicted oxidoreductase